MISWKRKIICSKMKCLVYFSILCLLEFTKLNDGSNCSIGWLEHKNYCYFFHNVSAGLQGKNWTDALTTCQRYTGNLLSVADSEENAFVLKQLNNDLNSYWIGLNDIKNKYEWSDNASVLFFNWKTKSLSRSGHIAIYPPNHLGRKCVETTLDGWSMNLCDLLLGFICKVKIGFCLEETIGDDDYTGVYTMPKTPVNQLFLKPCVYNTSVSLTRQCVWNLDFAIPEWQPDTLLFLNFCPLKPNTTWQSQQIFVLENVTVTKENIVNITDGLNNIILNQSLTQVSEILRISNILKNVININSSSDQVTNGILSAVDNLLSLNRDLIKQANQKLNLSTVFLSQLDILADQQTSNITKAMKNIGFTSYNSLINSKPIYIFSLEMKDNISVKISSDDPRNKYKNIKDYIILPSQLFSEQSQTKVYSFIFRDKTFFEEKNKIIDSVILSATISDVYVKNSSNPIKMKFSSQKSIFGFRTCHFYNIKKQIWSSEGCNTINSLSSEIYCQCNHLTNFALILDVYQSGNNPVIVSIISRIGCLISITGLFITIVYHAAIPKLREKRAPKILIILCINLMSTLILFVAFVERTNSPVLCKIVASMLQFFILSTFFWMAVEGFNLYKMFVKVFNNSTKSRNFLLKSSLFAWGIPLIITIATAASKNYYIKTQTKNNPNICMHHGITFYIGILIPVGAVMTGNILVLTIVLRSIIRKSVLHSKCDCKKNVRSAFVCSLLLGTTWVFAVLAYGDARDVFQWLFCIFNSMQGFFIFIVYTFQNKQVKDHWMSFIREKWSLTKKDSDFSQKQSFTIPFEMRKSLSEEVN